MDGIKTKIQMVINTLGSLDMPSTYDNANHVLGMYQTLYSVLDDIEKMEVVDDGDVDEADPE